MADDNLAHLANIQVESNSIPAPVEQQSTETKPIAAEPAKVEPSAETNPEAIKTVKVETAPEVKVEPTKPEPAKVEIQTDAAENERAKLLIEARLRAERAEAEIKKLTPAAQPLGDRPKQPVLESFSTLEDYQKACIAYDKAIDEWHDRRLETANSEAIKKDRIAFEQARVAREEQIAVATKESASRTKHKDYDAVITPFLPVVGAIPILRKFISEDPMGTEVAYELAKSPAILEQLSRQNIWDASKTLLGMADRLKNPPAAVKVSAAPEPITATGGNETLPKKLAELSDDAYFEARKAQDMKKMKERYVN